MKVGVSNWCKMNPDKAKYILNREDMLKQLKRLRPMLQKIVLEGIETEEEKSVARVACSVIVSDFYYNEAVMEDKTGKDGSFPLSHEL